MGGWIAASAHRAGGELLHDPRPPKRAHAACGGMQGGCARDVPRNVGRRVDVRVVWLYCMVYFTEQMHFFSVVMVDSCIVVR